MGIRIHPTGLDDFNSAQHSETDQKDGSKQMSLTLRKVGWRSCWTAGGGRWLYGRRRARGAEAMEPARKLPKLSSKELPAGVGSEIASCSRTTTIPSRHLLSVLPRPFRASAHIPLPLFSVRGQLSRIAVLRQSPTDCLITATSTRGNFIFLPVLVISPHRSVLKSSNCFNMSMYAHQQQAYGQVPYSAQAYGQRAPYPPQHQQAYPPAHYAPPQPQPVYHADPNSFRKDYSARLAELTVNSRPIIQGLSMMAQEYSRWADIVGQCIDAHIRRVSQTFFSAQVRTRTSIMYWSCFMYLRSSSSVRERPKGSWITLASRLHCPPASSFSLPPLPSISSTGYTCWTWRFLASFFLIET